MKKNYLITLLLVFGFVSFAEGQTAVDGDFRSRATGNWNAIATWQVRSVGSWAAASVVPSSTNNVFIQSGHTVTLDATGAANGLCNNLNINTAGVLQISNAYNVQASGKIRAYTGAAVVTTGVGDFIDVSTTA